MKEKQCLKSVKSNGILDKKRSFLKIPNWLTAFEIDGSHVFSSDVIRMQYSKCMNKFSSKQTKVSCSANDPILPAVHENYTWTPITHLKVTKWVAKLQSSLSKIN